MPNRIAPIFVPSTVRGRAGLVLRLARNAVGSTYGDHANSVLNGLPNRFSALSLDDVDKVRRMISAFADDGVVENRHAGVALLALDAILCGKDRVGA